MYAEWDQFCKEVGADDALNFRTGVDFLYGDHLSWTRLVDDRKCGLGGENIVVDEVIVFDCFGSTLGDDGKVNADMRPRIADTMANAWKHHDQYPITVAKAAEKIMPR